MRGLDIQILPIYNIGRSETSALQIWSALPLKMSDHIALGYPDHPYFLPWWKCVEHTLALTDLPVPQRPDLYCWGSFYRCEICRMISGGVGAPPELHRGVERTCCLSYGLLGHTRVHGRGLPFGILIDSQGGEKRNFPVHPGGCIFWSLNLFTQCHESHWCLFSWIFISCFRRS